MQSIRHFPDRDRLSVLTAVILLAYALTRLLDLPGQTVDTTFLGSPLGFQINGTLLMMVLVAALISTGADTLFRSHPTLLAAPRSTISHWILPGATALVLGAALDQVPSGLGWLFGLALAAGALVLVLMAEYTLLDPTDTGQPLAVLGLTSLTYGVALVLFILLHSLSTRAIIASSVGGLVAGLLALRLFLLHQAHPVRALLYAALVGLIVAETVWAINYWRVTSFGAALLAMLPFYLSSGLAQQHLAQRLTRRVWIEYGIVGGLSLIIALIYALG